MEAIGENFMEKIEFFENIKIHKRNMKLSTLDLKKSSWSERDGN